jgi:hypothetical protein
LLAQWHCFHPYTFVGCQTGRRNEERRTKERRVEEKKQEEQVQREGRKKRVGVRIPVGSKSFSVPRSPDWLWGPPNFLSPGVKRRGREADHSPPAKDKVKKMWVYTSTPPYAFIA